MKKLLVTLFLVAVTVAAYADTVVGTGRTQADAYANAIAQIKGQYKVEDSVYAMTSVGLKCTVTYSVVAKKEAGK